LQVLNILSFHLSTEEQEVLSISNHHRKIFTMGIQSSKICLKVGNQHLYPTMRADGSGF